MRGDQPVDLRQVARPDGIDDLLVLPDDLLARVVEGLEPRDAQLRLGHQRAEHPVETRAVRGGDEGAVELEVELGDLQPGAVAPRAELVDLRLEVGEVSSVPSVATIAAALRSTAERAR